MDYLAFLQKEIHAAAFATLAEDGRPEVRIIDIMLYDGHSLYFLGYLWKRKKARAKTRGDRSHLKNSLDP